VLQLGLGANLFEQITPAILPWKHKSQVVDAACGSNHTILIDDQYNLYSFGRGDQGQLGMNNTTWHSLLAKLESQVMVMNKMYLNLNNSQRFHGVILYP
jgi:alpha-tubulin suppressor-like RCC1 family protein